MTAACGTVRTLHVEHRTIRVVTLPMSIRATSPWPWLPVAMRSALTLVAKARSSVAGSPCNSTFCTVVSFGMRSWSRVFANASPAFCVYVAPQPCQSCQSKSELSRGATCARYTVALDAATVNANRAARRLVSLKSTATTIRPGTCDNPLAAANTGTSDVRMRRSAVSSPNTRSVTRCRPKPATIIVAAL